MVAVGGSGSALHDVAVQAGAPFVPVRSAGQPRATLWALSMPPLFVARALGLLQLPDEVVESAAKRLEDVSFQCRPSSESFVNPAKGAALGLAGSVPMIWGTSALTSVVAYRFACQLNENAKYPAVYGALPEANHNQVVAFDGAFARSDDSGDFFRDRVEQPESAAASRLRLVVLRDTEEHPQVAKRRAVSVELAEARGIPVTEFTADAGHPLERLAGLAGLVDYVTVYLGMVMGVDPTPVNAIEELKAKIADNHVGRAPRA
jgi:glucose/mannose-6-phosphate isomerase